MNDQDQWVLDGGPASLHLTPEWDDVHAGPVPRLSDRARSRVRGRFEQARAADPVAQRVTEALQERERHDEVVTRLDIANGYGPDNFTEGTVLRFRRQFRACSDRVYTYAAVKAAGRWYATDGTARTWYELVAWLVSAGVPVTAADVEVLGVRRTLDQPPVADGEDKATFQVL